MRWSGRQSARPDTADPTSDEADVATCRSGAHPALPYSEHSQSPRNRWQPVGDDANGLYQFQECAALDITRFASPETYTPRHLAQRILTSKPALEGERKQVTVLFADLKGSMELLADRDAEEARKILDPVLERMMEAVHQRYCE